MNFGRENDEKQNNLNGTILNRVQEHSDLEVDVHKSWNLSGQVDQIVSNILHGVKDNILSGKE